jgi:DNA transformation protein and related proteins
MKTNDFVEYIVHDLLAQIDGINARAMFGGHGLYKDGIIFGVIMDGELYFKTNEKTKIKYEKYGSKPFTYSKGRTKSITMSYWKLPAEIMDDPDELKKWVVESCRISRLKKK